MKVPSKKNLAAFAVLLPVASAFAVFLLQSNIPVSPQTEQNIPRYLNYGGEESRVFLASESACYSHADHTYFSADGVEVSAGSQLYVVRLTLRNDYSSDAPPPPAADAFVTPIDGTAYLCINFTVKVGGETVSFVNVTPSDFSAPSSDQTGLVLASGQTYAGEFYLATNQTGITQFEVNLTFVGDSIALSGL